MSTQSISSPQKCLFKTGRKIVGIFLALILLFFAFRQTSFSEVISTMKAFTLQGIIIFGFSILSTYVLDAVGQYVLLDSRRVGFATYVTRICQAHLFSLFMPGRTGDVSLMFIIAGESKAKIAKTYLFSKLFTVGLCIALAAPLIEEISVFSSLAVFVAGLIWVGGAVATLWNFAVFRGFLRKMNLRILNEFLKSHSVVRPAYKAIIVSLFILTIRLLLSGYGLWMLVMGVHNDFTVTQALSVQCAILLASLLPVAPMGLGIVEWGFIVFVSVYGLPGSTGISIPIIGRLFQLMSMSFFALTLLLLPFRGD